MADVFEGAKEQFVDVFVCQGIINELPRPPEPDQVGISEDPELVGNRRLAHAECLLQLTHREFLSREEGAEYAHPGQVAYHLQELACLLDFGGGGHFWSR